MTDKITVLYDTIRLEEKLLIKAAERHDINIEMVDCKQLFVDLNENTHEFGTVLQRCVSYYRNIHSTAPTNVTVPLFSSTLAAANSIAISGPFASDEPLPKI